MSALKSDFVPLYLHQVSKLNAPWKHILSQLETITVSKCIELIGTSNLDIAGVFVKGQQFTFENISSRLHNKDVADFLLLLHGLSLTMVTGELHEYVEHYIRLEWVPFVLSLHIENEPVFALACKRSLKLVAEWMTDVMRESKSLELCGQTLQNGDSALHMAVRRRQWDWAAWLLSQGVSPYLKNSHGESPIMLVAPHHEKMDLFCLKKDAKWFDALHDALVAGRNDATWCVALIDRGADVNQLILYDSPIDSLVVLAKHGMDMNLGPIPEGRTADQLKVFYVYGRKPEHWQNVISAFPEMDWIRFLHSFYHDIDVEIPIAYSTNIKSRQAITKTSIELIRRMSKSLPEN